MSEHGSPCTQGPRFDSLEEAIKGIHETLKQLTDLMIAKAESDTKMAALVKSSEDHEDRIRKLETKSWSGQWVERLAWVILVGIVTTYFKLNGG